MADKGFDPARLLKPLRERSRAADEARRSTPLAGLTGEGGRYNERGQRRRFRGKEFSALAADAQRLNPEHVCNVKLDYYPQKSQSQAFRL